MKKKILKGALLIVFVTLIVLAIYNTYNWIVSGEQRIKISTATKAYTNSELNVSIVAQKNNVDLNTETKIKLLDSKGRKVKDVEILYDKNNATIKIPDIEPGKYIVEAKVSSKEGKDTIQKNIYISEGTTENVTISLDKGIYKPGDTVNFRALLTTKENDKPVKKDTNISIYDGNDNRVYNQDVNTSDYGIISGTFTLADEVNSGFYKLVVKTNTTETTKQFKVNPYVIPKYETEINFDKNSYLVGDIATINIDSKYFFGEPVSNAKYTVDISGEKYLNITADQEGKASINYEIKEAKTYTVKVETVDSSNYYVESENSFVVGTDLFELELLPEYGTLVANTKNDVYVFTKNANGQPIKTYITISSGDNYTKQVATDENGVGKFSIDIESIGGNINKTSSKSFKIVAENMNGEKIEKNINLSVQNKSTILGTNKVKYNQGEDIEIKISSNTEEDKNIYFFKNDKLIKILSTDSPETNVNLDETYGLIDIYIKENNNNLYKKTIFIKPEKSLNIGINTDKQEYKPGENISISFGTKDENNNSVEAALLVSMLDNSILNLADNDLSIDNIKLALSELKFSEELDAATLYSAIIDDTSEQTMMGLLLKQSNKDIYVTEEIMYNYEQEEKSAINSIVSIIGIVIIAVAFLCYRFNLIRNILKHFVNYIVFSCILIVLILCLLEEVFDMYIGDLELLELIGLLIVNLAIYILGLSKLFQKTYKTSISIIVSILLLTICAFLIDITGISTEILTILIALTILVVAILIKTNSKNKIVKKFIKGIKYIGKFLGATILSGILVRILQSKIIADEVITIPIFLIVIYILNYWFNMNNMKVEEKECSEETTKKTIVYILAVIGLISVLFLAGNILGIVFDIREEQEFSPDYEYIPSPGVNLDSITPSTNSGGSTSNTDIGIFPDNLSDLNSFLDSSLKTESNDESLTSENVTIETTVDDNIRNIFLESMCFVPELITENGNAQLDLKLSDNITTWTIQTIGNTKDGRIGYGALDNVRVFKEFFVDFELPKNLVETDIVNIPVTVYNYTTSTINTTIKVETAEWFSLNDKNSINIEVKPDASKMIYIPITVLKAGDNKFRVEATSNSVSDIIEKEIVVNPKGYKIEKVVSTGFLGEDISEDILILENIIENTASVKIKIYPSTMSQNIEGMENIFKMPTGCFEQVSSSLYPNILALKYLEENGIVNEEIKNKAIKYISSGYQKLLTYEVMGESGGYSLYGYFPAETVLTAYGLMELTDLKEVYDVDEKVIKEMTDFLYKKQNLNGTFTITGSHIGGANSREKLALNAYITWALSESNPNDNKLSKSIEYLKDKLDDIDDNYTLALIANCLANVGDKEAENVIKRLVNNVNINESSAYITSNVRDYYGSRGNSQTIQTVALTSMALSKTSKNPNVNKQLINYLIGQKDTRGTWYSTQATILSLKALNELNEKNQLDNQTITVKVNSEEQKIEIKNNLLEVYELTFKNLVKENKLNIDIEKGDGYYEVVEEYYIPYEKVDISEDDIEVAVETNNNLKVNEILEAKIKLINRSDENISNGMVTISIPQGFVVDEESLMTLESKGIIEKYETSYTTVNLYLRDFEISGIVNLNIKFRASYPVDVTGLAIRAYDYYNPEIEGRATPISIKVNK